MVKVLQTLVHFWDIGVKSQTTMNTLLLDGPVHEYTGPEMFSVCWR